MNLFSLIWWGFEKCGIISLTLFRSFLLKFVSHNCILKEVGTVKVYVLVYFFLWILYIYRTRECLTKYLCCPFSSLFIFVHLCLLSIPKFVIRNLSWGFELGSDFIAVRIALCRWHIQLKQDGSWRVVKESLMHQI